MSDADRRPTARRAARARRRPPPPPRRARRPRRRRARVAEFRPRTRALPRFHVWTLGCQMNHTDSEEMAGRLLAAGCAEAPSLESADLIVINTCAIREAAEQKVIGRQGHLARLKARESGAARRADGLLGARADNATALHRRYPAVDLFLRPDEEPELVDRLGLASAQAPVGLSRAAPTVTPGRPVDGRRGRSPAGDARRGGRRRRRPPRARATQRLAADHLRLRQDLHLLHRAVQPRPGAQPPVRRGGRRGTLAGRRRLPRGHAARPERQLLRSRPAGRGAFRRRRHGALGRPAARPRRPAGHRRAAARHRRPPHRRRRARRSRACAS